MASKFTDKKKLYLIIYSITFSNKHYAKRAAQLQLLFITLYIENEMKIVVILFRNP